MARSEEVVQQEKEALAALLEERGPLGPTLCVGWTTSDLAAHLYVRIARPVRAAGILVPRLSGLTARAMDEAKRSIGYEGLVSYLREGPTGVRRRIDSAGGLVEYFVHHEDVRRAVGEGEEVPGSRDDPDLDSLLWRRARAGWLFARKLKGCGLELVAPSYGRMTLRRGSETATLSGSPQELLLYLAGRQGVARVELSGPEAAKRAVSETSFGL